MHEVQIAHASNLNSRMSRSPIEYARMAVVVYCFGKQLEWRSEWSWLVQVAECPTSNQTHCGLASVASSCLRPMLLRLSNTFNRQFYPALSTPRHPVTHTIAAWKDSCIAFPRH